MPLYEFVCAECGNSFEKMLRFSQADEAPKCPVCGSEETTRQISTFATFGGTSGSFSAAPGANCSSGSRFR